MKKLISCFVLLLTLALLPGFALGDTITMFPNASQDTYWQMDISDFDIYDADTQKKLWEYMMQPVTVADVEPTEHIYSVKEPGQSASEEANITGQIHGKTQALNVIREENGWSLVEYYSNDGYRAQFESVKDYAGLLVSGWVRSNKLITVTPNKNIGLVIDKLTQTMYIFEKGVMTGELLVSTGLPTAKAPNTETPAGEFLVDSWVGMFDSYDMYSDKAIRINGGVLIHEVPHKILSDGSRRYSDFEPYLGQKASHGCIRVQRVKNSQGQSMTWLWNNLKKRAKVLVIEDSGRALPPPDLTVPVYYNPNGGKNFHGSANCSAVKDKYLPLAALTLGDLYTSPYDSLTPCAYCAPPRKPSTLQQEVPDDILGVGDSDATEKAGADEAPEAATDTASADEAPVDTPDEEPQGSPEYVFTVEED